MHKMTMTAALLALGSATAGPVATITTAEQDAQGSLTVAYTLEGGPAVVLLDVQTNSPSGWLSIGGENISGKGYEPEGAVHRVVSGESPHAIIWRPDMAWKGARIDGENTRVVVEAYPLDDTPDYLVVDLLANGDGVRYYRDEASLPGGLLANSAYRVSKIVLRRVRAKGVVWSMGSERPLYAKDIENNVYDYPAHSVTLDHDYYMGVFEVTQGQFRYPWLTGPVSDYTAERLMRAQDNVSYQHIREWNVAAEEANYPEPPAEGSWLGMLRAKTVSTVFPAGLDFDLPSEAEWEFAARGGSGSSLWPNGRLITDTTDVPGWYSEHTPEAGWSGPAKVGLSEPNVWGIYDMLGNVWELCNDWYAADITALNGVVNANGAKLVSDPSVSGANRVIRGGAWSSSAVHYLYPARRGGNSRAPDVHSNNTGFRLVCRAGLK